jgi:hypothetical protein
MRINRALAFMITVIVSALAGFGLFIFILLLFEEF